MTMARHQFTVTDSAGNVVPGAHVEVRLEIPGQPLATLKSDRDGLVAISNPFNADPQGFAAFHVTGGAYQVRAYAGPSLAPTMEQIWRYVAIGLSAESDSLLPGGTTLTEDITFYVRPSDGDDENDGFTDSPSGAFETLQGAYHNIRAGYFVPAGSTVTIKMGTGFFDALVIDGDLVGGGALVILGDEDVPGDHLITPTGKVGISVTNAKVALRGIGIQTTSGKAQLFAMQGAEVSIANMRFGDALGGGDQMLATDGGIIYLDGDYAYGGTFSSHIHFRHGGKILPRTPAVPITATAVGTPTATNYFIGGNGAGSLADLSSITWANSGAVVGHKAYLHNGCGFISGTLGNLSWLPGSLAMLFSDSPATYDQYFIGGSGLSQGATLAPDAPFTANANTAASKTPYQTPAFHGVGAANGFTGTQFDAYGTGATNVTGRVAFGAAGAESAVNAPAFNLFLLGQSYDSSGNYNTNASIEFAAANSQTGTDHAGYMRGRIVPSGATGLVTAWQVGQLGGGCLGGFQVGTPTGLDKGLGTQNVQVAYYLNGTLLKDVAETLTFKTISGASNTLNVRINADVSGMGAGVGTALTVAAGAANGFATLDGGGKLASSQIPASLVGAVVYQGTWNATTNSPALASGVGTKGFYYKVGTAGTTSIDGTANWRVGDTIIFDGTTWDSIDGTTSEVISVAGLFGVVSAASLKTALAIVVADISDFVAGIAASVHAATSKATPVDADELGISDSAASFGFKKLTWANLKATLFASPTLTGTPVAPTAAVDTNTTQLATTAMVLGQAAAVTPLGNGTAAVGASTRYARADHVHPIDTRLGLLSVSISGVNFNSGNTDNAIPITLPPGMTRFQMRVVYITNASAPLTTSTFGVFTATGGGGNALVASGTANTVSSAADNTSGNASAFGLAFVATQVAASLATPNTIYFRVQTPQGSPATGTVTIQYYAFP